MRTNIKILHVLYTETAGIINPAGQRLTRGESLPVDTFEFKTMEEAEGARTELQAYVDKKINDKPKVKKRK